MILIGGIVSWCDRRGDCGIYIHLTLSLAFIGAAGDVPRRPMGKMGRRLRYSRQQRTRKGLPQISYGDGAGSAYKGSPVLQGHVEVALGHNFVSAELVELGADMRDVCLTGGKQGGREGESDSEARQLRRRGSRGGVFGCGLPMRLVNGLAGAFCERMMSSPVEYAWQEIAT